MLHQDNIRKYSSRSTEQFAEPQTQSPMRTISSSSISKESDLALYKDMILMPSPVPQTKLSLESAQKKIRQLRKSIHKRNAIILRLTRKVLSSTTKNFLIKLLTNKCPSIKTLVHMQLFHKNRTLWTKAEKLLALSLYYTK